MWKWLNDLDRILRGEATQPEALREGSIRLPAVGLTVVLIILGMLYGASMGSFAVVRLGAVGDCWQQMLASAIKVPAMFLLTLAITFPSLYVFNALVGSQLRFVSVLHLLIAALSVNLAVLASFGPIVAFFSVCTPSATGYPFILLLNVAVCAVSGFLGLNFLLQTLHRLSVVQTELWRAKCREALAVIAAKSPPESLAQEAGAEAAILAQVVEPGSALDPLEGRVLGSHVKSVFGCWIIVFGLVGTQMSWLLRPFIGNPNQPFEWFRPRESNFFQAVWQTLVSFFP
jgi:hypothetical protein